VAPDWIPVRPAHLVDPAYLASVLLSDPNVTGVTISGGEPMLQAQGLVALIRELKRIRDVNAISFSGYTLEQLVRTPPGPGVTDFLDSIDILIDGPYIQQLNDNQGLRGSRNQRIHYLTERLQHLDFESMPRTADIMVQDGQVMLVGVPSQATLQAYSRAVSQVKRRVAGVFCYERA
jgi:anaerobic ribonucleoside-triphosphate reductase activating protein